MDLNGVPGHWVAESVSHGSTMKWHEHFTTHFEFELEAFVM